MRGEYAAGWQRRTRGRKLTFVRSNKEPVLRSFGYAYNFDRMVYFNRAAKKAFSVDWLEDHTDEELRHALEEQNGSNIADIVTSGDEGGWRLYLNSRPSQSVVDAFLAEVNA